MAKTTEGRVKSFLFREFLQNILSGTASARYAGWGGQDRKRGMDHSVRKAQP